LHESASRQPPDFAYAASCYISIIERFHFAILPLITLLITPASYASQLPPAFAAAALSPAPPHYAGFDERRFLHGAFADTPAAQAE